MTTTAPMYWLRQVQDTLAATKEIPLFGAAPEFPWEPFSLQLAETLAMPGWKISPSCIETASPSTLETLVGNSPHFFSFSLSPLPGTLHWVMAEEMVLALSQHLLVAPSEKEPWHDTSFCQGFYQFLLLHACQQWEKLSPYEDLHILAQEAPISSLSSLPISFIIHICMSIAEKTFTGYLILPLDFHRAFVSHFTKPVADPLQTAVQAKIALSLAVEIGYSTLCHKQWKEVEVGDLLVLERCTYDPEAQKGRATLSWKGSPLFHAKLRKNTIKILDYATYSKEVPPMDNEREDEDAFLEEESMPELEMTTQEAEQTQEEEDHLWETKEQEQTANPVPTNVAPLLQASTVELPLVIEVDRIQMSLEKLLSLTPGNLLELQVRPEQGVHITLQGQRIAKGELVKVGDLLGVRIVEIGHANME